MLVWLVARATDERYSGKFRSKVYLWPKRQRLNLGDEHGQHFDTHTIVGIARIRAAFVYDHLKSLTASQREQYDVWRQAAPSVHPHGLLYFWDTPFATLFDTFYPDSNLLTQRRVRKHFMEVDEFALGFFSAAARPAMV